MTSQHVIIVIKLDTFSKIVQMRAQRLVTNVEELDIFSKIVQVEFKFYCFFRLAPNRAG